MNKMDKNFQEAIDKLTETEDKFLDEHEVIKNEFGSYVFISQCGKERIELSLFLYEYKQWLIENKLVYETINKVKKVL